MGDAALETNYCDTKQLPGRGSDGPVPPDPVARLAGGAGKNSPAGKNVPIGGGRNCQAA